LLASQLLFLTALGTTLAVVFWRGGREERAAAFALMAATALTPIALTHGYTSPEIGVILIDLALFTALAIIALKSVVFWPMWAAGFQLCALSVHMAAAQMPLMLPAAYAETLVIWSYLVLAALGLGTWFEAGKRHGQS